MARAICQYKFRQHFSADDEDDAATPALRLLATRAARHLADTRAIYKITTGLG